MATGGSRIGTGTLIVIAVAAVLILKPGGSAPSPTLPLNATIGAPFSINGWTVKIWQLGKLEDMFPAERSVSGEQMWVLDVEMTNLTGHEADVGTGFRLQDANGVIKSANPISVLSPELTGTLAPGGHLRGYLPFRLSVGVPPVAVIVQPGDAGDQVTIPAQTPAPSIAVVNPTPTAPPSAAALVTQTPKPTPMPKPIPTPKPTPTLAPNQSAWLKQYCNEVLGALLVASDDMGRIYSSGSTGWIIWNTVEAQGSLAAMAGNDALSGAKRLPAWPPAKKANALLVKAATAYVSTGSAYEQAGSNHSKSEYDGALLGDNTIDADHNASVEVDRLMSAYGLGCH